MKNFGILIVSASCFIGLGLVIYGEVHSIEFERHCEGYLKRAADANTVELARQELAKAVQYIEDSNLTAGSTHVFYATPECELDFWYTNLKASLLELESFPENMDQLTVSNQLIKLRETLMDSGKKGTKVTAPPNVHVFPNQLVFKTAGLGCLLGLTGGFLALAVGSECERKCVG